MNTASATRSPFNRIFRAMLASSTHGDVDVVVRRMVGDGWVFVEMGFAPPLRSMTFLHFQHVHEDGEVTEIIAECEVAGCHWQSKRSSFTARSSPSSPPPDHGGDWTRIVELRIVGYAQTLHDENHDHIH